MAKLTTATPDGEIKPFFFKTPFNHDTDAESARTALTCPEPTLTQQHSKEEADINTIVKNFGITGKLPEASMPPTYADFADVFDFQSAMNLVNDAKASFLELPASVRATFNHDPGQFVGYVDHCLETGDLDPLVNMGLAVNRKPTEPPKAPSPSTDAKDGKGPLNGPKEPSSEGKGDKQ